MEKTFYGRNEQLITRRTLSQKVCIGMGIFFVMIGLVGIVMPSLMRLHLSLLHNIIHLAVGAIALWSGYADNFKQSYHSCISFGVFFGILGVMGFVLGYPAYPGVGFMEADQNLIRIIPNALEFGTSDHILHLVMSAVFIGAAYFNRSASVHQTIEVHPRTTSEVLREDAFELRNSDSNLKDADLGESDINPRLDHQNRHDFEHRI